MIGLVHSCGYFRELSFGFGVVRVMFGIPKRVTSLCLRACSEIFSLFLCGDTSDYWGYDGVLADLCRLRLSLFLLGTSWQRVRRPRKNGLRSIANFNMADDIAY